MCFVAHGAFPVSCTGRLRQKRGTFFRLQVYEMKRVGGFIQVEVYEMIGKSVIEICERTEKGLQVLFIYLFICC